MQKCGPTTPTSQPSHGLCHAEMSPNVYRFRVLTRVLLMGGGDLAKEVRQALLATGAAVDWLDEPDDESVRAAVGSGDFDVACVASREDAFPLRIALLVRQL